MVSNVTFNGKQLGRNALSTLVALLQLPWNPCLAFLHHFQTDAPVCTPPLWSSTRRRATQSLFSKMFCFLFEGFDQEKAMESEQFIVSRQRAESLSWWTPRWALQSPVRYNPLRPPPLGSPPAFASVRRRLKDAEDPSQGCPVVITLCCRGDCTSSWISEALYFLFYCTLSPTNLTQFLFPEPSTLNCQVHHAETFLFGN